MRIVVRADSSKTMGFGHVTRSLSLALALKAGGADVLVVGQGMREGIATSPSFHDLAFVDLPQSNEAEDLGSLLKLNPDGLVVDGYHFPERFFRSLEDAKIPYAVVDDNGATYARNPIAVHNQNPHATVGLYGELASRPLFLLGLEYSLLRPDVARLAARHVDQSGVVVVSLGGTDPVNLTRPITKALLEAGFRVSVNARFREEILYMTGEQQPVANIEFFSSPSFLEALASADMAVLGAGTTLWEANALGTSAVGVIFAENQRNPAHSGFLQGYVDAIINSLDSTSVADTVSEVVATVSQLRQRVGRELSPRVPTDGADRVARALLAEFADHSDNPS